MPTRSNWSGTVRTSPAVIAKPASVEDVVTIVTDAQGHPSPVRPIGSFFSTTDCGSADAGTLVDMTRMSRVIEITDDAVRVEAGAIYKDVADALARHGKAFFVDLQVGNATLGSVATCATKDGSFPGEHGEAGAYVTRIKWVTAAGQIRETDERDAELFCALRSSYGLLGVVVEVTVRIRSLEPISIRHVSYTTEGFLSALPELRKRNGSLCFYLFPFADRVTAQLRGPAAPGARLNRWVWRCRNLAVAYAVPLGSRCASLVPVRAWRYALIAAFDAVARWLLAHLLSAGRTLSSDQITRYPRRPLTPFTFSIFAFPEADYARVLRAYFQFCADHYAKYRYRPDLLTIGYRVAQSRHALFSYSWDGDVLTIDPVALGGPEWDLFADRFNEFCAERGGKPLPNQTPRLTGEQMRAAFGARVEQFNELRRALDPAGRLLGEPLRRLLG